MSSKVLLVGGCAAPYHRLEPAEPAFRAALQSLGLEVTVSGIYHPDGGDAFTGDYSALQEDHLKNYDAVVLYTTGAEKQGADIDALVSFVESGKALIGVHNAADSFTKDAAFVALIGGKFRTHPAQLDITTDIVDPTHPITNGLETFTVHDELYLFSDYNPAHVHLLAQTNSFADERPVPIAWTREQGAGRVFYLSLGHNPTTLEDGHWKRFFTQGVEWALRRR